MSILETLTTALPHPEIFRCALAHTDAGDLAARLRNTAMSAIRANLKFLGIACPASRAAAITTLAACASISREHGWVTQEQVNRYLRCA